MSGKRGEGRDTSPPFLKYPRWKASGRDNVCFSGKKMASRVRHDRYRPWGFQHRQGLPYRMAARANGPAGVHGVRWRRCLGTAPDRSTRGTTKGKEGPQEGPQNTGGVPVSTGWQEVQIACRGWSAGHVKSRPSFNCRSSVFSGCLIKQPRAMAPVGRASQSVAKSDSPRFTAWYGRG